MKLTISYDGRRFVGSQRQGEQRTVQSELETALASIWKAKADTVFAGRTDRGVHAAGQVVSTSDQRPDLSEWQLRNAINAKLPLDVAVATVERVDGGFHARYDAKWREYRYRLWVGVRQPLVQSLVARRDRAVDFGAMTAAAGRLNGEHDFAAFAGGGEGVPWSERQNAPRGSVRNVFCCEIRKLEPWWGAVAGTGELIEIRIVADGFLPRMVRNIAGTLIEVGSGERSPDWIAQLLAARDRRMAGKTAPAHGLTLWRVGYEHDAWLGAGREKPNVGGE